MRPRRACAVVLGLAAGTLVLTAAPAAAHGDPGIEPTNYQTRVRGLIPAVAGIRITAVDLGDRLELANDSRDAVEVLDADGRPFLRVEPGETARWHEHRAVWDGGQPPAVRRDPDQRHVVRTWEVELRRHGDRIVATGDIVWIPPPSPWPWVALAAPLLGAVVLASRAHHFRLPLSVALVAAVVATALLLVGRWGATTESFGTKLAGAVYGLAGVVLGIAALAWLLRARDPSAATPAVLVAGIVILIAGGLAHVGLLGHSQLPTDLPALLARLSVAASLGLGVGLVAAAGLRLRPAPMRTRARPAEG